MEEILTIEEVSNYLRVSERTVYDWAQRGEIPCGKIGTVWRFKRSEIEKWIDSKLTKKNTKPKTHNNIDLTRIVSPERIIFTDFSTKHDVLISLIEVLSTAPQVKDKKALENAILEREALMSTALGNGIAVPHVRIDSVSDLLLALAISKKDIIDFNSFDGEPVRLVFMLVANESQHAYYLQTMSHFTFKLKDKAFREKLLNCTDAIEAYKILSDPIE